MVKCSKTQVRQLKTALRWKIPAAQRQRIQMVLLRECGMAQPAIAAAMGVSLSTVTGFVYLAAILDAWPCFLSAGARCVPCRSDRPAP